MNTAIYTERIGRLKTSLSSSVIVMPAFSPSACYGRAAGSERPHANRAGYMQELLQATIRFVLLALFLAGVDGALHQARAATWVVCANEDQTCNFAGTTTVRFGLNGTYAARLATTKIACTVAAFGDPLPGVDKVCEYDSAASAPPPSTPPSTTWTRCAVEDATCTFMGTQQVRFGANGAYSYLNATSSVRCSVAVFGDPAYGVDKTCDYGQPQSATTEQVWSNLISFPLVPVAAANLPNGKVLTWSAYSPTTFGGDNGQTYSALFDPATRQTQARVVTETGHDMFCPGTSLLADGRLLVNGGSSSAKTSIYNFASDSWNVAAEMNYPRGYQGNATLSDGSVLTLGGSWSGAVGGKNGEIYTPGGGWRALSGIPINPFIGPDPAGVYRGDNHPWLFTQANGKVFYAGPSASMKWIDTTGTGTVIAAGMRGDDSYSMNGNAVMYDIGKILKTGGAPAYEDVNSTASSYVINITTGSAVVRKVAPMRYARAMHNSVVLPSGQVLVTGGQTYVKIFSDDRSVLMAELWDPITETFSNASVISVPRNYHSFSLLLPDARVLVGGGGLCNFNCTTNHLDAQVFTPPYLIRPDGTASVRPKILTATTKATYGGALSVTTDSAISAFVLMRLSSVTHSLNNDQRRVPVQFTAGANNTFSVRLPTSRGIAPPGYYMLFAFNSAGVPSVSSTVQIQ